MMKYQIKQNAWGNWNGYKGARKVQEFGTRQREAEQWLRKQTGNDLIDRVYEYLLHQTQYASKDGNRQSYDYYYNGLLVLDAVLGND